MFLYVSRHGWVGVRVLIITIRQFLFSGGTMGNSLHNKIYLGRTSVLATRRGRAALAVGTLAGAALVWMALRALR
jgi:hypothetical protein